MKLLKPYKISWYRDGEIIHEERFYAQDEQEAVRRLASSSKDIANKTFDIVELALGDEETNLPTGTR